MYKRQKQLNELGYADSETSGVFSPDDPAITAKRNEIKRANHHEEVETLRALEAEKDASDRDAGAIERKRK